GPLAAAFPFTPRARTVPSALSLHDALPISSRTSPASHQRRGSTPSPSTGRTRTTPVRGPAYPVDVTTVTSSPPRASSSARQRVRSEEHTSELQSRVDLVCRLLLEKKTRKCA